MARHGGGSQGPKTAEVIALLRTYPEEIEADIARYYPGRDVGQYWRGEMSARQLSVLILHLPEDSATARAQRGTTWTDLTYLVAYLADLVAYFRADYINAHGGNSRPTPIPRPVTAEAVEQRAQTHAVHDALVAMMSGHPIVDAPVTDGRAYDPEVDVIG